MGNIQDLLAQILSARYGRDVRQSIHDAIETCYEDGHAGAIDLQARTLLGDTDISGISETVTGAVVELGGAVGTAQTTADGAATVADRAEGKADNALTGLDTKQKSLNNGTFTGNIDTLFNDAEKNGFYFVHSTEASGSQPEVGYYSLLVFGNLQLAVTARSTSVYFSARTYDNEAWSPWKNIQMV